MRLSKWCMAAVRHAVRIARGLGSRFLLPEHFIAGMLQGKNSATRFLMRMGVPIPALVDAWIGQLPKADPLKKGEKLTMSFEWGIVARRAEKKAVACRCNSINAFHALKGFLDIDDKFEDLLEKFGVTVKMIDGFFSSFIEKARRYSTTDLAIA